MDPKKLIASVAVCLMAGLIGSFFTAESVSTWYASLKKPELAPPNSVFGPVWTTLYILMGVSLYMVWMKGFGKKEVRSAVYIFAAQLSLNTVWSLLFFGLRNPLYAFLEIMLLWLAIAATMIEFNKISKNASLLLIPYILWVSFAAYLNYMIWQLN